MSDTPQCDKLAAGATERDTINDFLDWLGQQGLHVAEFCDEVRPEPRLIVATRSYDSLALEYLGVDPAELERERRRLLRSASHGVPDDRQQAAVDALRRLHHKARG